VKAVRATPRTPKLTLQRTVPNENLHKSFEIAKHLRSRSGVKSP
jgi:hypothetical protein